MPQSLGAVYLHVVFSTRHRDLLLYDPDLRERTHSYLGGLMNSFGCQSIIVGGVADHVHLLFRYPRTETIAKVVGNVKARSSSWVKQAGGPADFEWQAGYGVFSVGVRELDAERQYIARQEEHHRRVSFQDEYRQLLREHDIEFDERYLWD